MQTQPVHPWHVMSQELALDTLASHPAGLTADEAQRRLDEQGSNRLTPPLVRAHFTNFFVNSRMCLFMC